LWPPQQQQCGFELSGWGFTKATGQGLGCPQWHVAKENDGNGNKAAASHTNAFCAMFAR